MRKIALWVAVMLFGWSSGALATPVQTKSSFLKTLYASQLLSTIPGLPNPAPSDLSTTPNKNAPGLNGRGHWEKLERETGFEPATLSLGS